MRRDQRTALSVRQPVDRADIGAFAEPEADDVARVLFGLGTQPCIMRAVERDDRGSARLQPFENLALRIGDRFFAGEIFHMRRRDRGDDRDMRTDHARQRCQLAGVIHPHLEHAEISGRGHARQAQRNTDVVVITFDRAVRFAGAEAVERREQCFLRPRLACRSGDADDPAVAARARCRAESIQRCNAVGNANMRMVDRAFAHDPRGARLDRLGDEFVSVGFLAFHRDEKVARRPRKPRRSP